jgi:N-acyl homoserine lactone hydrolase
MIRGYSPQRWPNWFRPVAIDLDEGPFGPFAASKRLTDEGRRSGWNPGSHGRPSVGARQDGDINILVAGDTSCTESLMVADKIDGVSSDATVPPSICRLTTPTVTRD